MFNTQNIRPGRRAFFLLFPLLFLLFFSAVVMLLWNAILPGVLHVSEINYWQASGLLLLCRILFGGFAFGGRRRFGGPPAHLREKWMTMNSDEKEKFREKWKKRCEQRKP